MKAKNLNASSVKTRNLIRDTFAELLYEKKNINKTGALSILTMMMCGTLRRILKPKH